MASGVPCPGWRQDSSNALEDAHYFKPSFWSVFETPSEAAVFFILMIGQFAIIRLMFMHEPLAIGMLFMFSIISTLIFFKMGHEGLYQPVYRTDSVSLSICQAKRGLRFLWSEVEWREGHKGRLHVKLGSSWVCIRPNYSRAAPLLIAKIQEHSSRCEVIEEPVYIANGIFETGRELMAKKSPLNWQGMILNDGLSTLDLRLPVEPQSSPQHHALMLKQGSQFLIVPSTDPRHLEILQATLALPARKSIWSRFQRKG